MPTVAVRLVAVAGLVLPWLGEPAVAQDSVTKAVESLRGQARDQLLIRDLLDRELVGADGGTVGTVENFVVVPGGRLVAALVETGDGTRLAVPFQLVKLAAGAEKVQATVSAGELTSTSRLKDLAGELTPE